MDAIISYTGTQSKAIGSGKWLKCCDEIGADERDLPPLRSADAPTYWKLSMLMTSMMGDTTRVLSCREQQMIWSRADSTLTVTVQAYLCFNAFLRCIWKKQTIQLNLNWNHWKSWHWEMWHCRYESWENPSEIPRKIPLISWASLTHD